MKRITTFVLAALVAAASLFAGTEYTTTAFNGGFAANPEGAFMGFHVGYQFGADFSDDFNFGFGSTIDVDLPLKGNGYDVGVGLLFGPAFAVNTSPYSTLTVVFGPQLDLLNHESDEDLDFGGFGIGSSVGMTIYPAAEQKSHLGLGFTAGVNTKLMAGSNGKPYVGASGFVGITVFGDMYMYYPAYYYYDPYEDVLDYIFYN